MITLLESKWSPGAWTSANILVSFALAAGCAGAFAQEAAFATRLMKRKTP